MKVKALKLGYYNHRRWKEGQVFEMDENDYSPKDDDGNPKRYAAGTLKAGKIIKCEWVEPLDSKKTAVDEETEEIAEKPKRRRSSLHQDVL